MNEPRNEHVLIILLPCLSVIIAGLILLPRLRYYSAQRTEPTPTEAVAASAFDAPADQDAAVLPSSEVQPAPLPVQTPQHFFMSSCRQGRSLPMSRGKRRLQLGSRKVSERRRMA